MSLYNLAREKNSKMLSKQESGKVLEIANKLPRIDALRKKEALRTTVEEIEPEAAGSDSPEPMVPKPTRVLTAEQESQFNQLTKYIPTESITLYVASMAALPAFKDSYPFFSSLMFYWFFAFLTPIILWVVDFGQFKKIVPTDSSEQYKLPVWNMSASFVAFLCWALAVPNGPYLNTVAGGVLAALMALFISTFLGLIEKVVAK